MARRTPATELIDRERQAVNLARGGLGYADIAIQLGYANASGAWKAVQRALGRVPQGAVEDYRRIELARLDRLWAAYWPKALGGNIQAAIYLLKVSERRSRLLGMDAAVAIRATVTDALDAEIEELLEALRTPAPRQGS